MPAWTSSASNSLSTGSSGVPAIDRPRSRIGTDDQFDSRKASLAAMAPGAEATGGGDASGAVRATRYARGKEVRGPRQAPGATRVAPDGSAGSAGLPRGSA